MSWLDWPNVTPTDAPKSAPAIAKFTTNFFMARPLSAYRLRRHHHARVRPNLSYFSCDTYDLASSVSPVQNEVPVPLICECLAQVCYTFPRGLATSASVSAAFKS